MDKRVFEPDYSAIKKRVITGLVAEIIFTVISVPAALWVYSADIYAKHQTLDDLLLVLSGILLAHLIMSVIATIKSFRRCIKSASITEDGMKINNFEYRSSIDPDNLRGTGFNFTTGLSQLFVPCMGQDLIVIASDDSGKQIRRFFWTGPIADRNAKVLREDLTAFLKEGVKVINDRRFDLVRETVRSNPVTVKIDKNKFKVDTVKFSVIIGIVAVVLLAGAVMNIKTISLAVILTAGAGFLAAYWISIVMKTRSNIDSLVTELKLTDKTLSANGDSYDLKELKTDLICIGNADKDSQGSAFRFEPPKTRFEIGLYLSLSDSSKSNRYWLGPQIDSETAAAVILAEFAKKIAEEMTENS